MKFLSVTDKYGKSGLINISKISYIESNSNYCSISVNDEIISIPTTIDKLMFILEKHAEIIPLINETYIPMD